MNTKNGLVLNIILSQINIFFGSDNFRFYSSYIGCKFCWVLIGCKKLNNIYFIYLIKKKFRAISTTKTSLFSSIHSKPAAVCNLPLFSTPGFASSVLSHSIEDPIAANTPSSSFSGPLEHYSNLIQRGQLQEDQQQRVVLQDLDLLQKKLKGYSNEPSSFISRVSKYLDLIYCFFGKPYWIVRIVLAMKHAHEQFKSWHVKL